MQTCVDYTEEIKKCAAAFSTEATQEIILFHHNDTDGLASGAILLKAFERRGARCRRYALEKPYPQVLETFFSDPYSEKHAVMVFADFGSGMLPELSRLNGGRHAIFVLDHHSIRPVRDARIHLLNPLAAGSGADTECSASALCYHFVKALDEKNADLAALGYLGAVGDGRKKEGLNARAYADAGNSPLVTDAARVSAALNALGGVGYFRGGPDVAVKGLLEGFSRSYFDRAAEFSAEAEKHFQNFFGAHELRQEKHIQWFSLGDTLGLTGVKTVGLFCERLIKEKKADEKKYLAGFQTVPDRIPGLGPVSIRQVKISMRVPPLLAREVSAGKMPALTDFLPQATEQVGGFVDACHPSAAATTIAPGREKQLIGEMEKMLEEGKK